MTIFKSINVCINNAIGYEALYRHDRGSEQVIIKDTMISSSDVAVARAKAEFIKGGYVEKRVTINSIHISSVKQNDIISFKGNNWIVKEISFDFKTPKLIQTIKGVRYE